MLEGVIIMWVRERREGGDTHVLVCVHECTSVCVYVCVCAYAYQGMCVGVSACIHVCVCT